MFYIELIASMVILLMIVAIVSMTIPMQREMLNEAIRQEKAQLIAENMFWETIDGTALKSLPNNFTKEFTVEVDNQKYRVIIEAEKFDRQK